MQRALSRKFWLRLSSRPWWRGFPIEKTPKHDGL
jgi:hypothetical protein